MNSTTRPLGPGTCNTALNMTREERALWGRLAFNCDASLNQTIQELALIGAEKVAPELAAEIAKIRKIRGMVVRLAKDTTKVAVVVAFLLILVLYSLDERMARTVRVRRGKDYCVEVEDAIC